MVKVEDAIIAKLKKDNQVFEILVDCENALKLRKGQNIDIHDVLAVMKVFKDARKGDIAPNLEENFGTDDIAEIAKEIVTKGDIHLTMAYKKKLVDEKKREIIGLITRTAMDPVRKVPIPVTRIENAMDQVGVKIDPFKPALEQMDEIVAKLRPIMPISFENQKFEVLIPAQHASACYGILKKYGKIKKESWLSSGSLLAEVEMPAGISSDFIDVLNKKTTGDVQITKK
jgi:ribosome maturation protein SDO1